MAGRPKSVVTTEQLESLRKAILRIKGERSLNQLSKDTGVPRQTITLWLIGKSQPTGSMLAKLGISVRYA